MGQSMLGWKADEFFVAVRQHLDSLGPRGLEELRFNLAKAAANVASVSERLNSKHLSRLLENVQHMTAAMAKDFQQLDISLFHEASKAVQHTSKIAAQELTKFDINLLHKTFKAVQHTSHIAAQKLEEVDINGLQNTLKAFQKLAGNIALVTQTLPKSVDTFKHVLLFTVMMTTLATWTIVRSLRELDKHTDKISAHVQALGFETMVQANLNHQRHFAKAVYNLISLKVAEPYMYRDQDKPTKAQYIVFHPSSDWHASFFAYGTADWSDEFWEEGKEGRILHHVCLFNNQAKFEAYLRGYVGSSVIQILLPSAYAYTLPFTLRIPNGKPYCRACIVGVDPSDAVDVDLLQEHEAPDYKLCGPAPDKRIYPLLWLVIAALWLKEKLGELFGFLGEVIWNWCGCLLWPY